MITHYYSCFLISSLIAILVKSHVLYLSFVYIIFSFSHFSIPFIILNIIHLLSTFFHIIILIYYLITFLFINLFIFLYISFFLYPTQTSFSTKITFIYQNHTVFSNITLINNFVKDPTLIMVYIYFCIYLIVDK